ncbi:response regulator transcription factor [Flavilitoribacter nigricans]|uniref:DNA-binding response regulator n=1 Tax=Flavilitoribacter nigricans (strain ATCC 23147 / DSM 23189 / NBRC 102662 / NCIMB 1420 / SS-2) TaxID=1122177 RepID=A0A2D0N973_FLAN2|nr:response regulator transcription factor [Flavilitoribacter nigricans]PHN05071.1 DNA-binding response regulator [Flavilitoribacter nigricans DSM 23189 = NBRC 102662]
MKLTKILYVEDEPFLGRIVKESLESRAFQVRMIRDGAQALQAYRDFQPHVCVLDVMLPNRDGFAIGQDIREENPQVPIMYLTAKNQTEDVLQGFKSGGNDYLRKPFSMEELIVRVQNLLHLSSQQTAPPAPGDTITLGHYNFLPNKYELHFEGESRTLSHRETELLRILCEYQNRIVQRKHILQEIWGDDSFFNSRNLDVYITKMRDYLKGDPRLRIVTIKGVGYHFVVE